MIKSNIRELEFIVTNFSRASLSSAVVQAYR